MPAISRVLRDGHGHGKLEDSDPHYFVVHDNKLLLQRNEKAHLVFAKDLEGNHRKADANWVKLQEQAPIEKRLWRSLDFGQ